MATPIMNEKRDVIGSTFLWRDEWRDRYDNKFDVFRTDVALDDTRIVAATNKYAIKDAFDELPQSRGSLKPKGFLSGELSALKKIIPKMLITFQLRRGYGTRIQNGDGTTTTIGVDVPIYKAITLDLRMEPLAMEE
ncbi:hypothetical protein PV08_00359 [Exophiala spinifera]|uniref:Uncharacterized protein n=1 Tax=Exophiala spinifera TaxID=91928 RepID=A0A0D2C882_9EURO|nr:uncharacterized protein PV08_00359 [Exophiala spinifera]KIW19784.1 hypothetical protein PV08_00359 [Exophiala spinifera]